MITRLTVAVETPARRATSFMVAMACPVVPFGARCAAHKKGSRWPPSCLVTALCLVAAAAAVTATTFTVVVTMVVIVAVAVTAAAAFTVFVVMVVLAVYVAVRQFFFGRFADRDNFHVEVQVLAGQHVVAVNHHVVAVNFGDFNRYRALIGVSQETHADLQFVNAHEDVFRYALHGFSS